jgi:hypothetical protein
MDRSGFFSRHWPTLLIGSLWLWMFWPMISGQTVCGFRDSAYLYYPLFKWIDGVWASGEIPLWNPYCNYGLPVVGDGSSSVFYPGKLIFLCRFLSFPSRYGIYLSVHILIAAAGAYRFARVMKADQAGATLAAISYAFGGSVLFQVTNVIYLVSAAWLPFALVFVWRGVLRNDWHSSVWAGVVCALLILGGDPQMVYHVGLIAAASVLFKFWNVRRTLLRVQPTSIHGCYRWLWNAGLRLALMIVVTSGVAAIQILPTAHWAQRSERTASGEVSNVLQAWNYAQTISEPGSKDTRLVSYLDQVVAQSLFASPRRGTQKDATYQFSQPPWSLAELFFPNVMGKPFPTHQRWSDALPGAERVWTPSLYMGVLTMLLAIGQFQLWGRSKRRVWLCRIGLFFAIASFGWFGIVWLLNEGLAVFSFAELEIGGIKIGPQVGGLYWFMTSLLPKYFMFRYPAKLFVITSLIISALAGLGLSKTLDTSTKRKRVSRFGNLNSLARASCLYPGIITCGLCLGGLILIQVTPIEKWLERIRPNAFFGPLDVTETISTLNWSFAHPLIVVTLLAATLTYSSRMGRRKLTASSFLPISMVFLTAIELPLANHWLLANIDASAFESTLSIENDLQELIIEREAEGALPLVFRSLDDESDPSWACHGSETRLAEIVRWQRETLFPKHHLGKGIALLGSFSSVWPSEYVDLAPWSNDPFKQSTIGSQRAKPGFGVDARVRLNETHAFGTDRVENLRRNFTHLLMGNMQPRINDPHRHLTFVPHDMLETVPVADDSSVEHLERKCGQFSFKVIVGNDSTLVLEQLFDNGWVAQLENLRNGNVIQAKPTPFLNLWMQLPIKTGEHQVSFKYSPQEFRTGLNISVLSLLGFAIFSMAELINLKVFTQRLKAAKAQGLV